MRSLIRVRHATARRSRAETDWRDALTQAHADGESLRAIATEAGVSHVRVLQIVHAHSHGDQPETRQYKYAARA